VSLERVIADMHMHSRYSDGRDSPEDMAIAVAEKASGCPLRAAAALTDHNTVDGVIDLSKLVEKEILLVSQVSRLRSMQED